MLALEKMSFYLLLDLKPSKNSCAHFICAEREREREKERSFVLFLMHKKEITLLSIE
jgi:hypothetical protein